MKFLDLLREKYFRPMDVPWIVVQKQPFHFTAWLLVVPGVGFAGFWLPLVLLWARGEAVAPQCAKLLSEGTIASACAAILAEGLLAALTAEKSGTNAPALGLRGIAGGVATLLIILLIGTMVSESANTNGTHLSIGVHLLLAYFSLSTAAYLYCFRYPHWEKTVRSVEDVREEEDKDVGNMSAEAAEQTSVGEIKL